MSSNISAKLSLLSTPYGPVNFPLTNRPSELTKMIRAKSSRLQRRNTSKTTVFPQIVTTILSSMSLPISDIPKTDGIIQWGVHQVQQRASEDRYQVKQLGPFRYYAVFDGHGAAKNMGPKHVGDFCVNHLHEELANILGTINLDNESSVINAIKRAFISLDTKMYRLGKIYGSTCTAILVDEKRNKIYQINSGDSRSLILDISSRDRLISVTQDHNPDNPIEKDRIKNANGSIFRGRINGIIMVARAFGDFEFKKYLNDDYNPIDGLISALPDIKVTTALNSTSQNIIPTNIIVLTSDAPFENNAYTNKSLAKLVLNICDKYTAETLAIKISEIIAPKTTDDTTILISRW